MNKTVLGIVTGIIAGVIDVVPMIFMHLTWDANISAFTLWVVVGFLISRTDLKMNGILKGIIIAYLVLLPAAILIGWKEPLSLIPILISALILGGASGYVISRFGK